MDYIQDNDGFPIPSSITLIDTASMEFSLERYEYAQNKAQREERIATHQYIIDRCAHTKNTDFISKEILIAYGKLGLIEAANTYQTSILKSFKMFAHEKVDAAINQALAEKVAMDNLDGDCEKEIDKVVRIKEKLKDINSIYA